LSNSRFTQADKKALKERMLNSTLEKKKKLMEEKNSMSLSSIYFIIYLVCINLNVVKSKMELKESSLELSEREEVQRIRKNKVLTKEDLIVNLYFLILKLIMKIFSTLHSLHSQRRRDIRRLESDTKSSFESSYVW
jgi:hypothetical protein